MKKQLVYLATILLLLTACSKKEPQNKDNIDTAIRVIVKNEQGENLMDTLTPGAYRYETIQIYWEVDGVWKKFYEPLFDHPKGFEVYTDWNPPMMFISESYIGTDTIPYPGTLIQWNENDADTIRCEFRITPYSISCTKVWVNGEPTWGSEGYEYNEYARTIEIIRPD